MFGWLFASCPVDPHAKRWIEQRLRWLTDEFGSVTVDQVLYHLSFGTEGLMNSDPALFWRFVRHALLLPVGMALALWGADCFISYSRVHGVAGTWARIAETISQRVKL